MISESQIDAWVRANQRDAQGVIVELIYRLVCASCPKPKERRFPLGDSIGQPGPDGVLYTDIGYPPFVPDGYSIWEISASADPASKATEDYNVRTRDSSKGVEATTRAQCTFIFVTPLSASKGWSGVAQDRWLGKRRQSGEWREVCILDATQLVDWLRQLPAVGIWLAEQVGVPAHEMETLEQRWNVLRSIGSPPELTPELFLANREAPSSKVTDLLTGKLQQLELQTHFPDEVINFVTASCAALDEETKIQIRGRALIVSSTRAWEATIALRERHILVASPLVDLTCTGGTLLIQKALDNGHSVIIGTSPGGVPSDHRVSLPMPKRHQVQEALEKAGYPEERARALALKSDGNLGVLLRILRNLPVTPGWAESPQMSELAIATLVGAWNEKSEADRAVLEALTGETYWVWVRKLRAAASNPGTPIVQQGGVWRFISRFEGWNALGRLVSDEDLDRLRDITISVLSEKDPKLELPQDKRFAANLYGKVLKHSTQVRTGLAECLALLASYPGSLTASSSGKAKASAVLAVRAILADAGWKRWASLRDILPLLAEAAPNEFLDAVDNALSTKPCPFDELFAQEDTGIFGTSYISGLLWALERLAWDAQYLTRVAVTLGQLAARDPGGKHSNRPDESLRTILLPWMPQTCAAPEKRKTAVATLLKEVPSVGWELIKALMPSHFGGYSSGTSRPQWRQLIPEDWSRDVTHHEYWEQVSSYADLAVIAVQSDAKKTAELVERIDDLPPEPRGELLEHLTSDRVAKMPDPEKARVWDALMRLVTRHRKYADEPWALKKDGLDELAAIAEQLTPASPFYRHQRSFSGRDFDLFERSDDFDEQEKELMEKRKRAVIEIYEAGGADQVLAFAQAVEEPWRVGFALGSAANDSVNGLALPGLLLTEDKALSQFAHGFTRGRFFARDWDWADGLDLSMWTPREIGQLLSYLPFSPESWERASRWLEENESEYWARTSATPYGVDADLTPAVDKLLEHGRPLAALQCLNKMRQENGQMDQERAVNALLQACSTSEDVRTLDVHDIVEVIKALQEDAGTNPEDLMRIEWAYLPLLDRYHGASPRLLEQRFAEDPHFFCEVLGWAYRSKTEDKELDELQNERSISRARSAFQLIDGWSTVPGCRQDGSFDPEAFALWLETVKSECIASGHLEIAMAKIGEMLIHAPADPTGLWIHRSVAAALNEQDANRMRNGLSIGLMNARGVYTFTAGEAERELADQYRAKADAVEEQGYHRLADSLRRLAEEYQRQADHDATSDPFDD